VVEEGVSSSKQIGLAAAAPAPPMMTLSEGRFVRGGGRSMTSTTSASAMGDLSIGSILIPLTLTTSISSSSVPCVSRALILLRTATRSAARL
jgi:hypothetical protein